MAYNGNIDLIRGLRPKNNGNFPLVNSRDVYVDDNTRLDAKLEQLEEAIEAIPSSSFSPSGNYIVEPQNPGLDGQFLKISDGSPVWSVIAPENIVVDANKMLDDKLDEIDSLLNEKLDVPSQSGSNNQVLKIDNGNLTWSTLETSDIKVNDNQQLNSKLNDIDGSISNINNSISDFNSSLNLKLNKPSNNGLSGQFLQASNNGSQNWVTLEASNVKVNENQQLNSKLSEIDTLLNNKLDSTNAIPKPVNASITDQSNDGKILRINNGGTEWADPLSPTDSQVANAVTAWMNDPNNVNTRALVDDGMISYAKLDNNLKGHMDGITSTEASNIASASHLIGNYFFFNDKLYIATANIDTGDTIIPNTNCKEIPEGLASEIEKLNTNTSILYDIRTEVYNWAEDGGTFPYNWRNGYLVVKSDSALDGIGTSSATGAKYLRNYKAVSFGNAYEVTITPPSGKFIRMINEYTSSTISANSYNRSLLTTYLSADESFTFKNMEGYYYAFSIGEFVNENNVGNSSDYTSDLSTISAIVATQKFLDSTIERVDMKNPIIRVSKTNNNADYSTIKDAVAYSNQHPNTTILVDSGVYDIIEELGGDTYIESLANSTSTSTYIGGLRLGNNTTIIGTGNNVKLTAIYDAETKVQVMTDRFSIFNITGSFRLENLEMEVQNVRYCVHEDMSALNAAIRPPFYTAQYINCKMKHNGTTSSTFNAACCIGGGTMNKSLHIIDGCYLDCRPNKNPAGYHNNATSNNGIARVIVRNSIFTQGSLTFTLFNQNTQVIEALIIGNQFKSGIVDNSNGLYNIIESNNIYTNSSYSTPDFEIRTLQHRLANIEKSNPFQWTAFDKSYFIFIHDDTNEWLETYAEVFHNKNVPMGAATIPSEVTPTHLATLQQIVADGGEILGHYNASPKETSSDVTWYNCTGGVKKSLEDMGFTVRGLIKANSTGSSTNKGQKYCQMYFDYADNHLGKTTQYNLPRDLMLNYDDLAAFEEEIDDLATKRGIHAFGFHGGRPDEAWITAEAMGDIIEYINGKNNGEPQIECEITTYSHLFDTFGSTELQEKNKTLEARIVALESR